MLKLNKSQIHIIKEQLYKAYKQTADKGHRNLNWFDTLINDPSQVYFNIMVKGDSTISIADGVPNSMLKIEFYEDENGDGSHDATSEDMYETGLIPVDWTGWRMISIRYDDIENLPAALSSQGDGKRKPNEVYNVRTLLLANPNSGFAKADVDFLIWSIGAPILI